MKIEEPKAMQEIHEIRRKIHEEIKDMSQEEIIAYYKAKAAEYKKRSGVELPKLQKV